MKTMRGALKPRQYYTLVVRIDGVWHPEFGDFDREIVVAERDHFYLLGNQCKIIRTFPADSDIEAKVAELNAR